MATEKKPKAQRYTSPKGTFVYPYLVKPDFGQGQFANTKGIYKVNLRLSEEDAAPILEILQPIYDKAIQDGVQEFAKLKVEARKKLKSLTETPLYDIEYDQQTEEPTGFITFKFSTTASGTNAKGEAWKRTIDLFDAKGKAIKPPMVGAGTEGKVSFECSPYFIPATGVAGVKLYLCAAQILELSEGGSGGNASAYGFGQEEGYEADDDTPPANDFSNAGSDSSSGEDDDQF
jgi:hypothetical protein